MTTTFSRLLNEIDLKSTANLIFDSKRKPLSNLLNELTQYVVLTSKSEQIDEEIALGLQILLLCDVERVRAASIRVLRYSIHRTTIFTKFYENRLDYLICRSLVMDSGNSHERIEAYRFIRRFVQLYPLEIPSSFIYVLDSIVSSFYLKSLSTSRSTRELEDDKMTKACLELLCEIAVHNPHILNECHTIDTMIKFIIDFEQEELLESVIYSLLFAIERFTINDDSKPTLVDPSDPNAPTLIFIDEGMHQRHKLVQNMFNLLVAAFPSCEDEGKKSTGVSNGPVKESKKMKTLNACASALVAILHSWIGFATLCQSKNSSFRLLVNCLTLQSDQLKMLIIDLFYEILDLDIPIISDSYDEVLKSTHRAWKLTSVDDDYTFVAEEGAIKLPRLSSTRPNLLDSHMALLLLTFIDTGFIEAISEVASHGNGIISTRATLLLANFIWLCNEHLPEEQSFLLLPLLMDIAIADDNSVRRSFAQEAILNINAFFEYRQRTRHTYSFELAQLVYHSQRINDYYTLPPNIIVDSNRRRSIITSDDPLVAERIDTYIRNTNALQKDNFNKWNWDLILFLLKDFLKFANQIQGDLYERFLDKLFDFFKPEQTNGFRNINLTHVLSNVTCRCLLAFSDLLIYPFEPTSNHIKHIASNTVRTLLISISNALKESIMKVKDGRGKPIINENDLLSKNCVYYYLLFGRLSKSSIGTEALKDCGIFIHLFEMLQMNDDFVTASVVALSSFNYYSDGSCRNFLVQSLKSSCTTLRLYSTRLLRVILRCNPVSFGTWGLSLLCSQMHDKDQSVVLEAVSILDEALEDKRLVFLFVKQWDALEELKRLNPYLVDTYHLQTARLCSIPFAQIPNYDQHLSKVREELVYWDNVFNARYVTWMETKLFAAYSGGTLLTDEYFERRKTPSSSQRKRRRKRYNVHISPHIYRQLCLHPNGFDMLCSESRLEQYAMSLRQHPTNCISIQETQNIKEALWALAHTASTDIGYSWFIEKDLLADFLRFAEECQNLSVRGTAFYGLSLIAQTPDGAMSLKDFGWETYRFRAHSIPPSLANTESQQGGSVSERRMSRVTGLISRKSISHQISLTSIETPAKLKPSHLDVNDNLKGHRDSISIESKSTRSLTMPATILLNTMDKHDIQHGTIIEERSLPGSSGSTATVSFADGLEPGDGPLVVTIPIRRCSSISKELGAISLLNDTNASSGRTSSFSDAETIRSPSHGTYPYANQSSTTTPAIEATTNSLPIERLRPRSKSAHQSSTLRQQKQLQKVPEVIHALHAPTATNYQSSDTSRKEELYRSRLLHCNFLLKPDAAGYEYARRVQDISHAIYSQMKNQYDNGSDSSFSLESNVQLLMPLSTYASKFYKKIFRPHSIADQEVEKFTMDDGKFSFENHNFDDADIDGNTMYRGLAVPVDIRQVVEISDGYNLSYETWRDLVRSRSRANTNNDQTRGRSATNASNNSGEFAPGGSPFLTNVPQDLTAYSTATFKSQTQINVCMLCKTGASHDDSSIIINENFHKIKELASRFIVSIQSDEIEKQLLRWKEGHPQLFDNICLYSEICSILTLSSVSVRVQRFLYDLFSDCHFKILQQTYFPMENFREEEEYMGDKNTEQYIVTDL